MFRALFALLLIFAPAAAHAEWRRATSDNFIVYSDGTEPALRTFTAKVEAFDSLLRLITGVEAPPSPNKLQIYLLRDANAVGRLLGKRGRNVAGFYSASLSGAIAVVPRSEANSKYDLDGETVLNHEYAHHFMRQYFPSAYPAWYVEGFAEYYSTAEVAADGTASIGKPAYHRGYALGLLSPFPLARMFSADPAARGPSEMEAYYGRAWLLTHMLSFNPARKGQLATYLKAFSAGVAPEKAAADAFGPIPALEKDLRVYLRAKRMKYAQLGGLSWKAATIAIAPLDAAENALLVDRLEWRTGLDDTETAAFAARVRKAAARYPASPFALDLLADAELAADDANAAAVANDRLLALKPDHAAALLRKAAALEEAGSPDDDEAAHWKKVRALVIKANRIDNNDPVALFRYYQTFAGEGVAPSPTAVRGLHRALELSPQAAELRLTVGAQLIQDKQLAAARKVLEPLAYEPHAGEGAEAARLMIATIDSGGKTPGAEAE